ncbi:MAG TPA: pseudaminic acid cytidylyltransferase [Acidimicrobiaceae bacterium]|nr:pseudaminic acid cytidylyltransferase [Acidimicrobiaceae bacterium]
MQSGFDLPLTPLTLEKSSLMRRIAIIPARGGSKRILRKNIRPFHGRPIITYPIDAALSAELFDAVIVSTDDEEIAEIARSEGAEVPFLRTPDTSDDYTPVAHAVVECLDCYTTDDSKVDAVCTIFATAALVNANQLRAAEALLREGVDSTMCVAPFSYPIQRALHVQEGILELREPDKLWGRSQDMDTYYRDTGHFYWSRPAALRDERRLTAGRTAPFYLREDQFQDIDTVSDWILAELKYKALQSDD